MTNTKLTRRALLSSVLSLVLCFTMLLGTTFAWFTDEAVSSGNKIIAGNLDVQLLLGDGTGVVENYEDISNSPNPIFGVTDDEDSRTANENNADTLWEPGKTQVAYLAIANAGNLDLKYRVVLEAKNETQNLCNVMKYAITPDAQSDITEWNSNDAKSVKVGAQIVSVNEEGGTDLTLKKGETHYFALSIHMDENANNDYQGGKVEFDIKVLATQLDSESDSFGSDYDKDATYSVTIAEVKSVVNVDNKVGEATTITYSDEKSAISAVTVEVPQGALLEDGAKELVLTIKEEDEVNANVTVASTQTAKTYDIDIAGLADSNTESVVISMTIEKGLSGVELYHEDTLIDSTYDADTGVLTFATTGFSPFTVVHKLNAKEIDILRDKLAAAKSGDTVEFTLTQDAYVDERITVPQGATLKLDGNGHTIYADVLTDRVFYVDRSEANISNLTIKGSAGFAISTYGITDWTVAGYPRYPATMNLDNVTVDLDNTISNPVNLYGIGDITMTNCNITGAGRPVTSYAPGTQVFAGAEVNLTVNGGNIGTIMLNANYGDAATMEVIGNAQIDKVILECANNGDTLVVAPVTLTDGTIGETVYSVYNATQLKKVVEKVKDGDTIAVVADIADAAITVDKSLTITGDKTLNNVSITASGKDVELTVSGLNFTGNSWINANNAKKLTVSGVTADVTPSNGTATNSRSAFISLGSSEQNYLELVVENCNVIVPAGTSAVLGWAQITKATITGNIFGSEDAYISRLGSSPADATKFMSIANGATFTMTGNTVYSNSNGFAFSQNTSRDNAYTVYVDGNDFHGTGDHIWVEVSGTTTTKATIQATSNNTVDGKTFTAADIKSTSRITTWTSYAGVDVTTDADGKLTGGTFTAKSNMNLVAEGYTATANTDGTYTVAKAAE